MSWLLQVAQIFLAMVREIFDEASYARFLRQEQMESSPQAYSAFWRDRERGYSCRPKCC